MTERSLDKWISDKIMRQRDRLRWGENVIPILVAAAAVLALGLTPAPAADVKYYDVPRGAHPHDVAPAPDGTVWYTAQSQGAIGILDPKTGKATQIPLGAGAAPHGVIVGPDRAAWITEGGQNAIARVDPATQAVKLFPLPENFPDANLNTATFDRKGILWFTGQNGVYGRVDPATGKVEAWKAPKGVGPYGITTTPNGDVWYASLAGDHIVKIDTVSGDALMVPPPKPGVGPRRIWSDSKGLLWVSFWNTGEVGRFDPAAKTWKVWSLPKSGTGCYAVYVDDKDKVWLSDWVANAIVRFDPVSETFESFPSTRRGASVRQLLGRANEVWGAESGTDRLVVVRD
jgi:virginiamycin B lyase